MISVKPFCFLTCGHQAKKLEIRATLPVLFHKECSACNVLLSIGLTITHSKRFNQKCKSFYGNYRTFEIRAKERHIQHHLTCGRSMWGCQRYWFPYWPATKLSDSWESKFIFGLMNSNRIIETLIIILSFVHRICPIWHWVASCQLNSNYASLN